MKVVLKAEGNTNLCIVLDIIFRKTNPGERRRHNKKELIDMACMIFSNDREIACAIARQNSLDAYNKIVGKKVALAKAIAKIEFLTPIPQISGMNLRRRLMRKHIWEVFHKTFGRWN